MELASKIFDRLLQLSDLSSETQLAELAADIVAFLPPPGEARSAGANLLLQPKSYLMHAKTVCNAKPPPRELAHLACIVP